MVAALGHPDNANLYSLHQAIKPKPPVKWAGGKGGLLAQFEPLFPRAPWDLYVEPFVGGGAVFFHLLPRRAVGVRC